MMVCRDLACVPQRPCPAAHPVPFDRYPMMQRRIWTTAADSRVKHTPVYGGGLAPQSFNFRLLLPRFAYRPRSMVELMIDITDRRFVEDQLACTKLICAPPLLPGVRHRTSGADLPTNPRPARASFAEWKLGARRVYRSGKDESGTAFRSWIDCHRLAPSALLF